MRSALLALALLAGCIDAEPLRVETVVQDKTQVIDLPMFGPEMQDVLIVVDTSPAMAAHRDEVQALARAIPALLEQRPYGIPELHVGVTTTDPAHRGELTTGAAKLGGRYLTMNRAGDGTWYTDYRGDFADALAQMVDVGATGESGSVLDAMIAALRSNDNIGFLQPSGGFSGLTVIVISAGDDTGAAAPEAYAQALSAIERRSEALLLHAGPAPRLAAFGAAAWGHDDHPLDAAPEEGLRLMASGTSFLELMCWDSPIRDVDPATPGVQPSCAAEVDTEMVSVAMPACTDGERGPCYVFFEDPLCNFGWDAHLRIDFKNVGPYRPGRVLLECESSE